jgi:hypothetical protein
MMENLTFNEGLFAALFTLEALLGSVLLVAGVMKGWEWAGSKIDAICAEWADHAD